MGSIALQSDTKPYDNLTPDLILRAIESLGYCCSGSLFALNSYENRVYQIGIEDSSPMIAKFYRPHRWTNEAILEEHEYSLELAGLEVPIIAPVAAQDGSTLHHYENYRFALFPRHGGRALDIDNLDHLEWMGRFIGRMHAVGACRSYQFRPTLNVNTYGRVPSQFLLEKDFIPDFLRKSYAETVEQLLERITALFASVPDLAYVRTHGDCHLGNILWNDSGPSIVDMDDSLMAPAIQDIWMLVSGEYDLVRLKLDVMIEAYNAFYEFDDRQIRLIEGLRTLRMIQYAGWLANRWEDPAFPAAFTWFNTPHYWQEHIAHLKDQLAWLDHPLTY